ncbi:non-ribosomal peptide synthetase [Tumebacillus sp. BK434]|uniref:non-ribosomal peptide synthetase n=1 Tax=Tumebacillus sp. BK434 TaxID=2512169 RepID=UPI0014048CBD|nr:non-ribosomal peptide synthetase [Tumebacillus sp. BK434]
MNHTGNQTAVEGAFTFPASFAQQRLWFLDKLMPGSAMYNIPFAIRMQGQLNVDALKRSLEEIVARHETLRTVFAEENGAPMQVVYPQMAFAMPLLDLRRLPTEVRMDKAHDLAREDANRPFDLTQGPLMRTTLLKLDEQEHVLLLNMHHIISDGWSCGVMMNEMAVLYEAFSGGQSSPLVDLPIQYIDFTAWQMEHLSGAELDRQLSYWKKQLGDHPPVLQLPADRPRPALPSHQGGSLRFQLSKALSDKLAQLSQQEGATLYMTLLAAFSALLSRYTGQTDIAVGTPIAGRNNGQIEGLIGFFVNTLVMRTDLSGLLTFRDLLARVRQTALDAYAHQDLPFERLVEEVQPERNMSYTPLFQTMFALQNAPSGSHQLPGLEMSTLDTGDRTAKFDLNMGLSEHPEGISGSLEYSTDLFDESTIARMTDHFINLLESIVANPGLQVAKLPLLTQEELHTQLIDFNQNKVDYPEETVPALFAKIAGQYPDKAAVSFEGSVLTYRELSERANQLAHVLQRKGVGPDVLVGLCMERSLEMIIGLLAIVKAGGAYVPLDPAYPKDRIAYMLEDSAVGVLLTQEKLLPELPDHGAEMICLDRDWHLIAAESPAAPDVSITPNHLAYMIYTSGSTGRPKGVLIPHRGVVRLVINSDYLIFGAEEVFLQIAAISFDAATPEVWGALLHGAKLVVFPAQTPTVDEVVRVLSEEQITVALLTSGLLPQLAEADLSSIGHLKLLSVGGDVMSSPHAKKFLQKLPGCILANAYGPTENSVASTTNWLTAAEQVTPVVPIGRAIRNNELYVLDLHRQPLPLGVPGELYVGGPGLARGYLNRPELTAEAFISHPFRADGSRLYKTGDLVRLLPNGMLEFMGRIDHQVKVRGFRIELGEIEAVIGQQEAVKEAIVIVREDVPGDKRITAYVVPHGADVSVAELRTRAKELLPEYMVPSAFVVLAEMPLTPNGKIDRKALPMPDGARTEEQAYVAPVTDVEQKLAEIWADILRVDRIGQQDNFFEMGGHSLLATRLMSRVLDDFGVDLPLRMLFEAPTLSELAGRITEALGSGAVAAEQGPLHGVRAEDEEEEDQGYPTSFAQQRLWFLDQLIPNSPLYNIPMAYRVYGPLDVDALRASFNEIARRHETLRTTFRMRGTMPEQVIAPELELPVPLTSIEHLPEAEREAEVKRLADAEARQPFDLSTGPLVRAKLVRLSENDHLMMFTIHHIIADGWSYGVLISELTQLYQAFVKGQPSPLPELPLQYADFAVWQRNYLQGEVLETQLNYWRKQLGGTLPILELPTDFKRPAVQTHVGEGLHVTLPKELMHKLQALSKQEGSTLFMTLLAAFKALLFHYTKQDDILVGTPIANRNRSGIEGLIGFFVNTLVMRSDLSGDPSFQEMVQRVRGTALEAYQYQDVPFEKLVEELAPERDQSHSPIFQVMFALQNFAAEGSMTDEIQLVGVSQESKTAKFDLLWTMAEREDGLSVSLEYNVALFTGATIERMARHFRTLLEAAVQDPSLPISALPLMSAEEEQQVLTLSNGISLDYADGLCAHQMFEAQVVRTPEAVAVVLEQEQLTYAELNERANRLAHHLKARGVGPEVLVGLCMERSIDLAVATLGIMKAGGAYVPLDPAHPKDRIGFILEDAQVGVLVTQAGLVEHLPTDGVNVVAVDGDWPEIAQQPPHNPNSGETLDNALYVIYTSGTTGKPKGVMMTHRPLRNMISWQLEETPYAFGERTLQYASMTFDISFQEYFCTLSTGGTLVLVSEEVRRDPVRLLGYLAAKGVHRIYLPFVAFQQLCEVAEGLPEALPLQLKEITTAGDQLQTTRPVRNWLASLEGCRLYNQYGPTECHVVTSYTLPLEQETWPLLPPIGRPIGNTQIYILDPLMRPVPVGVPGEVYIGGMSLARGYLGRDELTAEKFVADPFSGKPGARLYRTGDLARYLPDGNIEFYGRIDTQVKIRGYRIELGEIETILGQHPGVLETVVMAREQTEGGAKTMLVAYVVLDQEQEPSTHELRSFLKERLPEYMVPQLFMAIDAVPLTPNRKIDRKALPAPDGLRPELNESFVAPRTATEELMAGIFRDVLKVERIGIHDHFFDMGGHSLLATQMISRIRQVFGMELPVRALFEAATVASLVDYMKRHSELATGAAAPPIVPVGRDRDLPLSFAQQRLWFIDRLTQQSSYNMFSGVRFKGDLNAEALERGLQEIVRRHEVLRTTFSLVDGSPVQVVHADMIHELEKIDLRKLPEAEREAQTLRLAELEARKPFDLSQGPLFRSTMLTTADDEAVLLFTMHHIVSDGWSIGVFVSELGDLYAAFAEGRPSPLPELVVQYADFAHWQRAWLEGDNLQAQLAHWKDKLSGAKTVLPLPHDHPRPPVPTLRGGSHAHRLSKELTDQLQALCQQEGVTMYMTLLAALNVLLYRYTGQDDILVGSPIAGRNRSEIEPLIGFFVNTLVLRTDLSGQPTFRELLQRVRQTALDSYAHQDLPFERLVEEVQPNRDMSVSPLFQVMFAVQNAPMGDLSLPGVTMSALEAGGGVANFELALMVYESEEGQLHAFNYQADLFEAATIERMGQHLQSLIAALVADPDRKIAELPLLSAAEAEQLDAWNPGALEFPQDKCAHDFVAVHASRTPEAAAVEYGGESLTYAELDARANALAHRLQSLGVAPDVLVGVCMEKSPEFIVSLLAVHKAGGAYVPIDPAHPQDRIAYMLEDAGLTVLLTKEHQAPNLPATGAAVVCVDREDSCAGYPATAPQTAVQPHHLAYLLYTSGSTGKPKAVMIEHRQLVSTMWALIGEFGYDSSTCKLSVTTMTFDINVAEIWAPLFVGGTTVLLAKEQVLNIPQLVRELRSSNVCMSVPSLMRHVAQEILQQGAPVTSLGTLFVGGEAVPADLQVVLRQAFPNARVVVAYGPTETTILCTFHDAEVQTSERLVIGRALSNAKLRVYDAQVARVPLGIAGELYIGGAGVGRGYLGQPELTAAQFVELDGERWYKSGDLVRFLPNGDVEFLGRIDHQVKIRGFRIEIGEIESLLTAHPQVALATVVALDDLHGEKRLVAYVEAEAAEGLTTELRGHLRQSLPEYMIPSAFVVMEHLPLTDNGKVDRRALPVPEELGIEREIEFVAPRDELETELAAIWEELLGAAPSVKDDFFAIGGHSLLAVRMMALIEQRLGFSLPLSVLFQDGTIAGLAELLRQGVGTRTGTSLVPVQATGSKPPVFFVHPVGGGIFSYFELARRLGADQPFYGLQALGFDDDNLPLSTFEEMAAWYIEEIRRVQAEGPYRLGGWSLGGAIAFEMTRQLRAQGEAVELLIMLDTMAPVEQNRAEPMDDLRALMNFAGDLAGTSGLDFSNLGEMSAQLEALGAENALEMIYHSAMSTGSLPPGLKFDHVRRLYKVFKANTDAMTSYEPADGLDEAVRVAFFRASTTPELADFDHIRQDPTYGWSQLCSRVEVSEAEGHHFSILQQPHVQSLAERLHKYLEQVKSVSQ